MFFLVLLPNIKLSLIAAICLQKIHFLYGCFSLAEDYFEKGRVSNWKPDVK